MKNRNKWNRNQNYIHSRYSKIYWSNSKQIQQILNPSWRLWQTWFWQSLIRWSKSTKLVKESRNSQLIKQKNCKPKSKLIWKRFKISKLNWNFSHFRKQWLIWYVRYFGFFQMNCLISLFKARLRAVSSMLSRSNNKKYLNKHYGNYFKFCLTFLNYNKIGMILYMLVSNNYSQS